MGVYTAVTRFASNLLGRVASSPIAAMGRAVAGSASRFPTNRVEAEAMLKDEVVANYRPSPFMGMFSDSPSCPTMTRFLPDVEAMVTHSRVALSMSYYKSGIANAVIELVDASSPEVGKFHLEEAQRFWRKGRRPAQESYEYGRGACEVVYGREDGVLRVEKVRAFAPLDCRVLVQGKGYAGVRLRSQGAAVDLWGPRPGLPGKVLWMCHHRRFHHYYGFPQLYPAWDPWRRLAGRDGGRDILDGGMYRFAFGATVGRYPQEDVQPKTPGGTTLTSRDKMRELLENFKSGGVIAFPSRTDEHGKYVWTIEQPNHALDVAGLVAYTDNLETAISLGVGVPPELMEASEVGSGYSGRAIPLETFMTGQQVNADDLLEAWATQVGDELLVYNFGPGAWAKLRVKNLLETRMASMAKGQTPPEGVGGQARPGTPPAQFSTFKEEEHPRARDGEFKKKGSGDDNTHPGEADPAEGRPSKPGERHKAEDGSQPAPKPRPWQDPPPKLGKKGAGMGARPKGDESQTKIGDLGESLATRLGFRSILPAGQRSHKAGEVKEKGSTIDLEYDHSGRAYELKLCNSTATEYRLKAKKEEKEAKEKYAELHGLTPHVMVAVRDVEKGEVHFYASKEPGLTGAEVSAEKYDYVGTVKVGA